VYSVIHGVIWAVPVDGNPPRQLHPGEAVAVDPHGKYLVAWVREPAGAKLVKLSLEGQPPGLIPMPAEGPQLAAMPLAPHAIGRDGRIAVRVVSSWYWDAAVLDPSKGRLEFPPWDRDKDMMDAAWDTSGRLVTLAHSTRSSLWRFRPIESPR
jgi:hypothetical protein